MAKRKKEKGAVTTEEIDPAPDTEAGPDGPAPEGPVDGDAPTPFPPMFVGAIVWYWDREEIVHASDRKREPRPFAAIVTGVDLEGEDVSLAIFHPHVGLVQRYHVRYSGDNIEANHFSQRPGTATMRVADLKALIMAAEEHLAGGDGSAPATETTTEGKNASAEA